MRIIRTAALAVILSSLSLSAQAALISYQYTWATGATLTGVFDGTVQPDGNTVYVTSITGSYAGANAAPFDLTNTGAFGGGPGGSGIVTLNGIFFNLYQGAPSIFRNLEFFIDTNSNGAKLFHPFSDFCCTGIVIEDEGIDPDPMANGWVAADHWTATVLPEPGTLSLLAIGLASVAWVRRRKIA